MDRCTAGRLWELISKKAIVPSLWAAGIALSPLRQYHTDLVYIVFYWSVLVWGT